MRRTASFIALLIGSVLLFTSCRFINTSFLAGNSYQCEEPITYRIGKLDERFEVSRELVKTAVKDASELWSDAANKKLGEFSDKGEVTINLIYDDRQKNAKEAYEYRVKLVKNKQKIDRHKYFYFRRDQRLNELTSEFKALEENHAEKVNEYEKLLSVLNLKETMSAAERKKLQSLKYIIEYEKELLADKRNEIEELIIRINENREQLSILTNENEELAKIYKEKFTGKPLEAQGSYQRKGNIKKINIYRFLDLVELRLVIAHEMGHAMGLGHVSDEKSVMYYKTVNESNPFLILSDEDKEAINSICGVNS